MDTDRRLVAGIQGGIEIIQRPFLAAAALVNETEDKVLSQIRMWLETGVIKRFGIVVRHRLLGYTHNAMVVWVIPDDRASALGSRLSAYPFVTLCYRRRRSLPVWRFNMYCMVHGTDRAIVTSQINQLNRELELEQYATSVLFSSRCFKQRGARYE
jgi:DNA-binding Lrp family transcriptional regulator